MNPVGTLLNTQVIINGVLQPEKCANYHCGNNSEYLESPFCGDCVWRLWAHIDLTQPEHKKALAREGSISKLLRQEADQADKARRNREAETRGRMTEPGTIYYLRIGDLIKIGFTIDMQQRMRQYPPNSELLTQHPGTRETERQMHHMFLHRVAKGREWFTPCSEIDAHIARVQQGYPQKEDA